MRITAQLIDAATGAHLWAERWDRPLGDVFAVQDEIARGVVATVAARVLEEGEAAARRRPPQDVRAYDLFLQGRRLSDMFTSGAQEQTRGLFERARRHLDLARAMNPNDAEIQITWAWAQACLGEPERGLPAAELAMRLNPRYYEHYRSRILFLGRRHAEAAAVLERITADAPLEHPRDLAWWAAACALLGRTEEARRYGELFVAAVRQTWRGDPTACPAEYVDWLVDVSYLQRPEDAAHLREGLRLAGLMA